MSDAALQEEAEAIPAGVLDMGDFEGDDAPPSMSFQRITLPKQEWWFTLEQYWATKSSLKMY